jgi:hypothetical protein
MSDKDFKVKNKLVLNGLTQTGPLVADANKQVDATPYLTTLQGGTGTTTSPSSGQILYSSSGTTYAPTTLSSLDVKGATYSADAPASPFVGQVWIESDSSSDSFDPNIIRRKSFTATAGQTTFTADLEFIQGYEQVFFNGMLLVRNSDYTTPTNTSVVLTTGAAVGDIVEIVSITNLNSINAVATTGANTITSTASTTTPLTIQGAVSQSANLLDIKNNLGSPVVSIGPSGLLSLTANTGGLPSTPTGTILRTVGADATTSVILMDGAGGGSAGHFIGRRAQGTIASPTATTSGVYLSVFAGRGYGNTGYIQSNSADIIMHAAETFTDTASGGYITFNTTPTGTVGTPIERMRIDSSGNVGIGVVPSGSKASIQSNDALTTLTINNTGGGNSTSGALYVQGGSYVNTDATRFIANFVDSSANSKMLITNSGRIGVGTTSPAARFHIDNTGGNTAPLRVKPPTGGYNYIEAITASTGNIAWGINDGGAGDFRLYQYDSNGNYARTPLVVESNGTATFSSMTRAQIFKGSNAFNLTTGAGYYNTSLVGLFVFSGSIPGHGFWDLVLAQLYGSITVISSASIGSPPTRTYAAPSGGTLGVQLTGGASGTYGCTFTNIQ